jgi:Protein of unknown function (DUF1570)
VLLGATFVVGCESSPSTTFSVPAFRLYEQEWKFGSHDGRQLTTDHFDLYTTSLDDEFVDFIPKFLETCFQFYAKIIPPPDDHNHATDRMRTYVLEDRIQWERFVKHRYPRRFDVYRMISAGGFAEGNTCVLYDIGRSATLSVLAHEGLHQYMATHFSEPLPAWLNEGLATYCESVEFRGDKPYFKPQHNTFRMNHLRNAIGHDATIPLRELLSTNAGEVIGGNKLGTTATYYAQAWALLAYLQHGDHDKYKGRFQTLLGDIANGTLRIKAQRARAAAASPSEISYGEAVFIAYITDDLDAFDAELQSYMRRCCWQRGNVFSDIWAAIGLGEG